MLLRTRFVVAIAALTVAVTTPAMADPPHGGPPQDKGKPGKPGHDEKARPAASSDDGHGRGEHGGKDRKKAEDDEHHKGEGGGPPGLSAKDDERHKKLRERFEERRKSRGERAKSERDELRRKHGASLRNQPLQQELRRHARTVARLERIKEIADADGKTELSARASAILTKENARHEKRLAALAAAPAASASGGAP